MSIFKEKKPLIEWEKEYDVWRDDLLPGQHFEEYTKLDAFKIFSIGNIRREWGCNEYQLYNNYIAYDGNKSLCLISGVTCDVIDNRKRSLIEWEKELGFYIIGLSNYEHLKSYNKDDAVKKLYSSCLVNNWNEEAEKFYFDCLYTDRYKINTGLSIRDFKYVNTIISDDNKDFRIDLRKKKSHKDFMNRNIKINNFNNFVKISKRGFKSLLSLTLSLVTTFSAIGFKNANNYCKMIDKDISSNHLDVNDSVNENLFASNLDEKKEHNDHLDNFDNMSLNKSYDVVDLNDTKIDVNLGDIITVKDGSLIYDNVYSAIDKTDGMNAYYSYDTNRFVNYIAIEYNDNIIYSNNSDDIDYYKSNGGKVVSVCTDDGFYNADDVVVKVKKLLK